MSVTIDSETLSTETLGLSTVNQVLGHVKRKNKLIVKLLIDGLNPDLATMGDWGHRSLVDHTIYIETAEPRQMACEVLDAVELELSQADRLKAEAVDLLQRNASSKAMEKLSGCFRGWKDSQESLAKVAELCRIDLEKVTVGAQSLRELMTDFSSQLRDIRSALTGRDFVTLCDILTYESTDTLTRWRSALKSVRESLA
jgi:hypothetical protein